MAHARALLAFYTRVVAPRLAKMVAQEMRQLLNVQAPTRMSGGRLVATTRATPGDPPRRVTGALYKSVRARGPVVYINKRYGWILDKTGHPFIKESIRRACMRSRSKGARVSER